MAKKSSTTPSAEAPESTSSVAVPSEILKGIFNDDPKGVYYSKDGETFYNEDQFAQIKDQSGFEKFENN